MKVVKHALALSASLPPIRMADAAIVARDAAKRSSLILWVAVALLGMALLAYSQTVAQEGDEGFELLAAQLINAGKRPYVDFFHQHAPLYSYLNAGWMKLFGETWRSAHLLSALFATACIALVARFVFTHFPDRAWRLSGGITAASLIALNSLVMENGTSAARGHALCMFLSFAAFYLTVRAVNGSRGFASLGAGLCAGTAAASSFLSVPVTPILFLWIFRHAKAEDRVKKLAHFFIGATIPFLPLFWLVIRGPRQVLFDLVEYNLFYRTVGLSKWVVAMADLRVLTEWLTSTQAILLVVFAVLGLFFLTGQNEWDHRRRSEFTLCAWLAMSLSLYLTTPQPTFREYFVLPIPFLSILASAGIYAVGSRIWISRRSAWLVLAVVGLFTACLAKSLYHKRHELRSFWPIVEELAQEINRVTPSDSPVYATEAVYFAARRLPPPGMENYFSRILPLPPDLASSVHAVPQAQINEWLAAGRFATVLIWVDDPRVESLGLHKLYARSKEVNCDEVNCYLFWHRVTAPH